METRWMYISSKEFDELREISKDVCLLPIGCIEKHGLHLPLGTDALEAEQVTVAASRLETACVAPTIFTGDVPEGNLSMPKGTMTFSLDLMLKVLKEECDQIARNGYKKILICNAHGGNTHMLAEFQRMLDNHYHPYVVGIAEIGFLRCRDLVEAIDRRGKEHFPTLTDADIQVLRDKEEYYDVDGHGGFQESSLIFHVAPETFHPEWLGIESGLSRHIHKYANHGIRLKDGGWGINHPFAYHGADPVDLNPGIAAAVFQLESEKLAEAVRFFKEDNDCILWHNQQWGSNL